MKHVLLATAALLASAGSAFAASGFTLDFNGGPGSTLADTGFAGAYNLDPAGFSVGGGRLTINTLPGDTFGNYENDPDTAKNVFYTPIDVGAQTIAEARVRVAGLNVNFHGGGVWIGTDQDHYVRLGVFHNSFLGGGPIGIELLRENEDRWGGAVPAGPGDDIVGIGTGIGQASPMVNPIDVILRLTRNGTTVSGEYSLDNGATFQNAGSIGGFALPGNPQGNGSNTIEGGLKAGLYAFGGPDGAAPGVFQFDSLVVTPEPASIAMLAFGGLIARRRR